jgi:alkanesulfonate monooxygenase SsuD/methylene tetrahydromethanopterin reductase-like flavin-dependent oxidoreductase (luciferase family)
VKLGAFVMPSHPPERALLDGYRWDLEQLVTLDRLGFHEAWIGISLNPAHTASHWTSIEAGALLRGREPDRREWRLVREVYVAGTDDESQRRAREGAMGRCWREYLRPFYVGSGMGPQFLAHPSDAVEKLDVEYLIEHSWFVGSPQTVVDKIAALQRHTGGFGGLLIMLYDFSSEPGWWDESLQRLVEEVMPHFQGAQPAG